MTRRTVEQEVADYKEAQKRNKEYYRLFDKAHRMPDARVIDAADIAKRAGVRLATAKRIIEAHQYRNMPHVHAVSTWHDLFGGRGCELGPRHPGCCPGSVNCDMPGVVGRYSA